MGDPESSQLFHHAMPLKTKTFRNGFTSYTSVWSFSHFPVLVTKRTYSFKWEPNQVEKLGNWFHEKKSSQLRHTYLAQRTLWSARQFLQVETSSLHSEGVEACDSPKCGELGSIICESWGLRSRSPLTITQSFHPSSLIWILRSRFEIIIFLFHQSQTLALTKISATDVTFST